MWKYLQLLLVKNMSLAFFLTLKELKINKLVIHLE